MAPAIIPSVPQGGGPDTSPPARSHARGRTARLNPHPALLAHFTSPRFTRTLADNGPASESSASGLGRATAVELSKQGGNIAVLDLNEDAGAELVRELGGASRAKFFAVDVTDTDSIAAAAKSTAEWVHETGRPLGGIIPAAGVGNPALVR